MKFPILILTKDDIKDFYRNSGTGRNNFNKLDFQFFVEYTMDGTDFNVKLICFALKNKREPMHSTPILLKPHPGGKFFSYNPPFKLGTLEVDKTALRNEIGIGAPGDEKFEFLRFEAEIDNNNYVIYKVYIDDNLTLTAKAINPCPPASQS